MPIDLGAKLAVVPRAAQSIWLWIIVPFALGIAGGYVGWKQLQDPGPTAEKVVASGRVPAERSEVEAAAPITADQPSLEPKLAARLDLLDRIAGADVGELEDLCRELLVGNSDYTLIDPLLDRWVELDPARGLAFVLEERTRGDGGNGWNSAAYEYCGRWAHVDPDSAFAAAQKISDGEVQNVAMDRISMALAARRPADFFRIRHSEGGGEISYWQANAALAFGMIDPQEALATIRPLESGKDGLMVQVVSGWAKNDPEGALAWVRDLEDEGQRKRAMQAVARRLIESDPDRSAAIYKESDLGKESASSGSGPKNDWKTAVGFLGETDPAAAIAWVAKHFPGHASNTVTKYLPQDAVAAVDAIAELPAAALRQSKLRGIPADEWRPANIEAAIEHLPSITDPVTRESAHAWLLGALARDDPGAAIKSAGEELSDPAEQAYVFKQGMASWARDDITAASEWLATRPPGVASDGAIASLIEVAKYLEPESAMSWAGEVSTPNERYSQLLSVYEAWRQVDEDSARAALSAVPLSVDEIAKLKKRGIDLEP